VHSDIKPDNILVKLNEDFTDIENLKFIDFGSAFTHDNFSNISGTTPEYLPPEILNYLDKRSAKPHLAALVQKAQHPWSFDVWSFGIILLEILTGFPIWMSLKCRLKTSSGKNLLGTGLFGVQGREGKKILLKQQTVFKNIRHTLKKYDCYGFEENDQLLDLIEGMLETNPQKRISPSEILQHPFIVE
jgi:serine/threonine protein kinase